MQSVTGAELFSSADKGHRLFSIHRFSRCRPTGLHLVGDRGKAAKEDQCAFGIMLALGRTAYLDKSTIKK